MQDCQVWSTALTASGLLVARIGDLAALSQAPELAEGTEARQATSAIRCSPHMKLGCMRCHIDIGTLIIGETEEERSLRQVRRHLWCSRDQKSQLRYIHLQQRDLQSRWFIGRYARTAARTATKPKSLSSHTVKGALITSMTATSSLLPVILYILNREGSSRKVFEKVRTAGTAAVRAYAPSARSGLAGTGLYFLLDMENSLSKNLHCSDCLYNAVNEGICLPRRRHRYSAFVRGSTSS